MQGAFEDLTDALKLMRSPGSKTDIAEIQRTYQLRARADASLGLLPEQIKDLSAAISLLDQLDAIEATNPYLYAAPSRASPLDPAPELATSAIITALHPPHPPLECQIRRQSSRPDGGGRFRGGGR